MKHATIPTDQRPDKNLGGRPRKDAAEKRTKSINVRVTPTAYEYFDDLARSEKKTLAEFVRDRFNNSKVVSLTVEEEAMLRQLAGMANNLNQLARRANTDGFARIAGSVEKCLKEIEQILDRYK